MIHRRTSEAFGIASCGALGGGFIIGRGSFIVGLLVAGVTIAVANWYLPHAKTVAAHFEEEERRADR